MGKRELLIITAFVVMGLAAYQLSAGPSVDGRRRFSLATVMDHFRRETTGRRARATVTSSGTITAASTVSELRISSVARVTVRGAAREDIGYTLTVEAAGPDEAAARQTAERTTVTQDAVGTVLSLRANAPREERQVVSLAVDVPATLRVRVEATQGGASIEASDVAEFHLDAVGDVRLTNISNAITGTHRNGTLVVADSVVNDLTLLNSEATFERPRAMRLASRNGQVRVTDAAGPVEIAMQNDEVSLVRPGGLVRVNGSGGTLSIEAPESDVHVDARRMGVDVRLARAVPLTILTTEEPLRLLLDGLPPFTLDAIATDGGTISAEPLGVQPDRVNDEARVRHTVKTGSIPVALRNRRGAIVISEVK
jgi:hypothetical protein